MFDMSQNDPAETFLGVPLAILSIAGAKKKEEVYFTQTLNAAWFISCSKDTAVNC